MQTLKTFPYFVLGAAMLASVGTMNAQAAARGQNLSFSGALSSGKMIDRQFSAAEGQEVRITLKGSHQQVYFMLWKPETDEIIMTDTRDWWGQMPSGGQFGLRLFLFNDRLGQPIKGSFPYRLQIKKLPLGQSAMTKMPPPAPVSPPKHRDVERVRHTPQSLEAAEAAAQAEEAAKAPPPPPPEPTPQVIQFPAYDSKAPQIEFTPKSALPPPPEPMNY